jgi:UDP-N-acetylglucosamine--N-acetylmuramyl-(pentapeptide) pyrophosphoryl-undecaprenol N-acetylglucosamine transferase
MFQPLNGVGLGHISRLSAIALTIRNKHADAQLPFLISGNSHSLLESLDLPYLTIPSNSRLDGAAWSPWNTHARNEVVYDISSAAIKTFKPQAIVFDVSPMLTVLAVAVERRIPIVLIIRKSRDMAQYYEALRPHVNLFSLFILPHEPGEFELDPSVVSRSHFVGQIVRPSAPLSQTAPASNARRSIVITGGGGGYPRTVDFYNVALAALAELRKTMPDFDAKLVTGPLFHEWSELELVDGVKISPFEAHMTATLSAADLVICQAGYNTVAEMKHLGVPTICVPAERSLDDQFERADKIAATCSHIKVWRAGAQPLSEVIASQLHVARSQSSAFRVTPPGARRAADLIMKLVGR